MGGDAKIISTGCARPVFSRRARLSPSGDGLLNYFLQFVAKAVDGSVGRCEISNR
jgi:hypothetical protein